MSESFLSIMGLLRNMPVGNLRQQFPARHGAAVWHGHRNPSRLLLSQGSAIAIVTGPCKML